jgi:hypothetical protein
MIVIDHRELLITDGVDQRMTGKESNEQSTT